MDKRHSHRRKQGFTLVELMVVIMIASILMSLAVPQFNELIQRNRLASHTNRMLGTVYIARSEAIKRGHRVTACVSAAGEHCVRGQPWHVGWIVFADRNGNALREDDEALIMAQAALTGTTTLTGNQPVSAYISYNASGRSTLISGALQMGTLTVCNSGSSQQLIINATGRPRLASGSC